MPISSVNVPQLYGQDLASVFRWAMQLKATLETTLTEAQAAERDSNRKLTALLSASRLQITSTVNAIANTTWTAVTWDSALFDDKTWFATAHKSRLTPLIAGRFRVRGLTAFNTATAGTFGIAIAVNGTKVTQLQGSSPAVSIEDLINLSAGDYVELHVYQSTGVSANLFATAATSYFSVERVT